MFWGGHSKEERATDSIRVTYEQDDEATRPWYKKKRWWAAALLVLVVAASAAGGAGTDDSERNASENQSRESEREKPAQEESGKPELTSGQENALYLAQYYLDQGSSSKAGLIRRLSSSDIGGYSKADAIFAANNVDVDWKEEAVEAAKYRLDSPLGFSKKGFIMYLADAGFSKAEVTYAVNHVGADWNAEAVERANLEVEAYSKSELIQALADAGFTDAQVRYAVEKVY